MDLSNLEYVERDGKTYEIVEIYFVSSLVKRVCLWHDDDFCITIDNDTLDEFLKGEHFCITLWIKGQWRPLQKKHYVPFTFEDAHLFRDRWIKNDVMWHFNIKCYDKEGIVFDYKYFSFNDAFKLLTFDDGTPFGKEVSHE